MSLSNTSASKRRKSSQVHGYPESNKRVKRSGSSPKIVPLAMKYGFEDDGGGSLSQFDLLQPLTSPPRLDTSTELNSSIDFEETDNSKSQPFASQEENLFSQESQPSITTTTPVQTTTNKPKSNDNNKSSASLTKNQQERRQKIKENELKAEKLAEEEKERLLKKHMGDESLNRELYKHFNDLRPAIAEHKLSVKIPEIVVVGMQSDGKSSFVEALLGFQFNMVDTNIGTRRPLILQMQNDITREKPHCVFWDEDLKSESKHPTPVHQLEHEIKKRTDAVCGKDGVSSSPIILNIHYKYCANLTIIDTPGFRKGEDDPLSDKIEKMVMQLIKLKERVIVCLEQSTVEWCNSQVRPMIQRVDPNFSRTVFVSTKFNNRNNQFRDREEVDKYLATDGQIKNLNQVFFISLPSGHDARDLSEEEFKDRILEVYLQDFKHLNKIGFDDKYKPQLGFYNLRRHLESLLNERYKTVLEPLIDKIQHTIDKRKRLVEKLEQEFNSLASNDLEEQAFTIIGEFLGLVKKTLNGTNMFNTQKHGLTLEEEREKNSGETWPNFGLDIKVRNSQYKLYGGSQLERLLAEFEVVAHSQEFPSTTDDEVAVTIGLNSLHTIPDYDRGASELAQKKCRSIFRPLLDVLLSRSRFIMKHMFRMILSHVYNDGQTAKKFSALLKELQVVCEQFLEKVLLDVRAKTDTEFDTFTKVMDWDLMNFGSSKQLMEYDLLNPTKEDTMKRVQTLLEESSAEKMQFFSTDRSRELTDERCKKIKEVAARLFAGVRLLFVKYVRAKYNAFFLDPIFNTLEVHVQQHFKRLGNAKIVELANGVNPADIKQQITNSKQAIDKLTVQKDNLQKLYQKFQALSPSKKSSSSSTSSRTMQQNQQQNGKSF